MKRLALAALFALFPSIAHATATVWDTASTTTAVTFSGSNTIVTSSNTNQMTRGADPQTSGKFYFECKLTVQASGSTACGIVGDYKATAAAIGSNATRAAVAYKGGSVWIGGATPGGGGATVGTSDVICVAVDLDNAKIWFRKNAGNWNNSGTADPSTNTGGFSLTIPTSTTQNAGTGTLPLPAYPVAVMIANGDQVTANFGGSAFAQSVPSGFTSGWTTNPITTPSYWYQNASVSISSFSGVDSLLAATTNAAGGSQTNYYRTTGKYYVEWGITELQSTSYAVGLVNAFQDVSTLGANNDTIAYIGNTGAVKRNASTVATYGSYTTGDTVSMAVDFDNTHIWFRKNCGDWNNDATANPATNTNGLDISALVKPLRPAWFGSSGSGTGNRATGSFGYRAFSCSVPSGFTAGWPINGPQIGSAVGISLPSPLTHFR